MVASSKSGLSSSRASTAERPLAAGAAGGGASSSSSRSRVLGASSGATGGRVRIGKYQAVADSLWANQTSWGASGKIWETIAPVLSPDEQKKVQALVKDPSVTGEVERELNAGIAAGVSGTPALFITKAGRRIPVGPIENYRFLKSLLDDLLK